MDTRVGEGGYRGNGGGICGEGKSQVDCGARLLDFEGWRQMVAGARESPEG